MITRLNKADGIHIWSITATGAHPRGSTLLGSEEKRRALAFHNPLLRQQWSYFHCALREILSIYLGVAAHKLTFKTGTQGKPYLPGSPALHFNLSHSREQAVIAITPIAPVGIDLEYIQTLEDMDRLARYSSLLANRHSGWLLTGAHVYPYSITSGHAKNQY